MKYHIFGLLFCFCMTSLQAQQGGMEGSTTQPSGTIQTMKPYEPPKTQKKPSETQAPPPSTVNIPMVTNKLTYFHPGILILQDKQWEGSDDLLNLSANIGTYATIVKPEDLKISLTEDQVLARVNALFSQNQIAPYTLTPTDQPPLPAFQVEILIYPFEGYYAAAVEAHLFESVTLKRFTLDLGMAYEAITWEKRNLVVGPAEQMPAYILNTVEEITKSFLESYQVFKKLSKK